MNKNIKSKPRMCYFCTNNIKEIDYKDTTTLKKFISSYGKIVPRKRSSVCMKHQRKMAQAIKRARIMGLLPFLVQ
ncbi:MAG: 30S ribosomal protein S18 [Parcubacteria group bacterium CG10_big_fil_rev_8_21_14_0_10_36_14]|nr:MAG: 30S ribosomal protein S18 [Parcubacteria group bacterium CG10_big_fil_rev_8_21_14_0_10_36_14]